MMLPTPDTPNLPSSVYPPSEDSYLLLDTLSSPSETAYLSARFAGPFRSPLILEVGTGSGLVLAFVAANSRHIFGQRHVLCLGVDVNPDACRASEKTVMLASGAHASQGESGPGSGQGLGSGSGSGGSQRRDPHNFYTTSPPINATFLNTVQADLTTAIRPRTIDVLIFNPPYVPTDAVPTRPAPNESRLQGHAPGGCGGKELSAFELESLYLDIAVSGGADGMQVTDRLLGDLGSVLGDRGVAYVLLSVRNGPKEVMARLSDAGWDVQVAGTTGRKGGIERLVVVRVARPSA